MERTQRGWFTVELLRNLKRSATGSRIATRPLPEGHLSNFTNAFIMDKGKYRLGSFQRGMKVAQPVMPLRQFRPRQDGHQFFAQ